MILTGIFQFQFLKRKFSFPRKPSAMAMNEEIPLQQRQPRQNISFSSTLLFHSITISLSLSYTHTHAHTCPPFCLHQFISNKSRIIVKPKIERGWGPFISSKSLSDLTRVGWFLLFEIQRLVKICEIVVQFGTYEISKAPILQFWLFKYMIYPIFRSNDNLRTKIKF